MAASGSNGDKTKFSSTLSLRVGLKEPRSTVRFVDLYHVQAGPWPGRPQRGRSPANVSPPFEVCRK